MAAYDQDHRVSEERRAFLHAFYKCSDTESALDEYADNFTQDTDFVMGPTACKGKQAVRDFRPSMWTHVAHRKHQPERIFVGADNNEFMIYGKVDYRLRKSGTAVNGVTWAGRIVFDPSAPPEQPKMALYHVWMDPTPMKKALEREAAS